MTAPDIGPYDSGRQAHAAAIAGFPGAGLTLTRAQNRELLHRALRDAAVETGAYDEVIIGWLAGLEDFTCQVIAGLIARASRRGMRHPVAFDLGDGHDTQFVLTEALEEWKLSQLEKERHEGGNEMRVRWASRADAMVAAIVAAAAEDEE